jgi:hypothetical protein
MCAFSPQSPILSAVDFALCHDVISLLQTEVLNDTIQKRAGNFVVARAI